MSAIDIVSLARSHNQTLNATPERHRQHVLVGLLDALRHDVRRELLEHVDTAKDDYERAALASARMARAKKRHEESQRESSRMARIQKS